MAAIALTIRLCDGRPVLFRQIRPGYKGKPFTLMKFRTMRDARDAQGLLLPDEERLTATGMLLRQLSLDELPQLWNVLRGEMSLVGPRPLLMQYMDRYSPEQLQRHDVKPGITGWAQVNGRNATTLAGEIPSRSLVRQQLELGSGCVDPSSHTVATRETGRHFPTGPCNHAGIFGKRRQQTVTSRRILVYGAGGHGKVVADIFIARGEGEFAGFVDDREELWGNKVIGFPVLGNGEWLREETVHSCIAIALGIGDNRARQLLADRCSQWGIEILTAVHPAATVSSFRPVGSRNRRDGGRHRQS